MSYQAVFDAAFRQFDISYVTAQAQQAISSVECELTRPSAVFRPRLFLDGALWCALYGDNLQDGVAGFGDSPANAMCDFDRNWHKRKEQHD